MKELITDYVFVPGSRQIIFTGMPYLDIRRLLLVTNVAANAIIYNFANPALGGSAANNVLTLDFNTEAMSSNDGLQIFLENERSGAADTTVEMLVHAIESLIKNTESLNTVDLNQRLRVSLDSAPATITVNGGNSTFRPVDSVNAPVYDLGNNPLLRYAAIPDFWRTVEMARQNYGTSIRANIQFS